ncbi:MAG: 50S ribosomal protein L9 [Acidobacteriota bacterium]
MRVLLREDMENLGRRGEVVRVAAGYARNYLLPKRLAMPVTPGNMKLIEQEQRAFQVRRDKEKQAAEDVARRIAEVSCTIVKKVGEAETLYGSVTTQEIGEILNKEGIDIDRRRILLEEPIKALGVYTVPIKVHPEVTADLKVWVVRE